MTNREQEAIASGAAHVDEIQEITSGYSLPRDLSLSPLIHQERGEQSKLETVLPKLILSMFTSGDLTWVRVGNAYNASELYESSYASIEEANEVLLDSGILAQEQVADPSKLAGTDIVLLTVTAEQLKQSGLTRKEVSTL